MSGGVFNVVGSGGTDLVVGNAGQGLMSASGIVDVTDLVVGEAALGVLAISGAATVSVNGAAADLLIGNGAANNLTNSVLVSGGVLTVGDDVEIGNGAAGFGRFQQTAGSTLVTGTLYVGDAAGATGEVVVAGATSKPSKMSWSATPSRGALAQSGGAITSAGSRAWAWPRAARARAVDRRAVAGGRHQRGRWRRGHRHDYGREHGGTGGRRRLGQYRSQPGRRGGLRGHPAADRRARTVRIVGPASSDNSDVVMGANLDAAPYVLAGGTLNHSAGDDLLLGYGELELAGTGWTALVDNDFEVQQASSTLKITFSAAGIGRRSPWTTTSISRPAS